jgi:DNA-binding NtrC family response regulator
VLPPLRERREDTAGLAAHFAAKAAEKHGRGTPQLSPELIDSLNEYDWPGNVRELENLMERLVLLDRQPTLGLEFLPEKMLKVLPAADRCSETTFEGAVLAVKKRLVVDALEAEGHNKVAAAKRLSISRSYLHKLISEFGLNGPHH